VKVEFNELQTLKLDEDIQSVLNPGGLMPLVRDLAAHWKGGWVGFGFGLDAAGKRIFLSLTGIYRQILGYPARTLN
jgi:hypothetical protein